MGRPADRLVGVIEVDRGALRAGVVEEQVSITGLGIGGIDHTLHGHKTAGGIDLPVVGRAQAGLGQREVIDVDRAGAGGVGVADLDVEGCGRGGNR